MRVGFHSPLPPAKTGVADYGATLVEALRQYADILANSPRPADVELYHLGNNQLHRLIYHRAMERPGVVVLHDASMQHFYLGSLEETGYVDEFVYNYGEWDRELGRELWKRRARSGMDARYFRYPMLRRIVETARAVVVHNAAATRVVQEHGPAGEVMEIPHLFRAPKRPPADEISHVRVALGVPPGGILFGVFGYLRESKRLHSILRAFGAIHGNWPTTRLLVAGEAVSRDLDRALEGVSNQPGVVRIGHLPEADFWRHAWATDVCVNLRYPAVGETSGIAIRLMGIGRALILSEGEENAGLPETSCLRVDYGAGETEMLAGYMQLLAENPGMARDIGRRAAAHITSVHSVERCAAMYWEALRSVATTAASSTRGSAPSARPGRP